MIRKSAILVTVVAVIFALLPSLSALASAPGTAHLANGASVFPGQNQTFSITVNAQALPINGIRINIPTAGNGQKLFSADPASHPDLPLGWTGQYVSNPNGDFIFLTNPAGIPPTGSQTFPFSINVPAPLNSDVTGRYRVQLSADLGSTFQNASVTSQRTLDSTVRILRVLQLRSQAPAGVVDNSGTGLQQGVTFRSEIRNFAQQAVTATPNLNIRQGNNAAPENNNVTLPAAMSIPGNGGTATFDYIVNLATSSNGDRSIRLAAGATAPGASATGSALDFIVERENTLINPALDGGNRLVRPGDNVDVNVRVDVRGTPALTLNQGTLTFAGTTLSLQEVTFPRGTTSGILTFSGIVMGADGDYRPTINVNGIDDNDKPFAATLNVTQVITIDGIAPIFEALNVALPRDGDAAQQSTAKTGDTISVNGVVDDGRATITSITLDPDVGAPIGVPVSARRNPVTGKLEFSGSVRAPFEANAASFRATGDAVDPAGNVGGGFSDLEIIDNIVPALVRDGRIEESTGVGTLFGPNNVDALIFLQFDENETLLGGCNPRLYSVTDANLVTEVRYTNGARCNPGQAGPSSDPNGRVLILAAPVDRAATPSIVYEPNSLVGAPLADRAKDGAGNYVGRSTIDTVSAIVPALPDLRKVFRNTSNKDCGNGECETAFFDRDEERFYTRFSGPDLKIELGGVRAGYTIEIVRLDQDGNLVNTLAGYENQLAFYPVPLDAGEGVKFLGVRFRNEAGAGPILPFDVVLDQTNPVIGGQTLRSGNIATGTDPLDVAFTEPVVEGTNLAIDWTVVERFMGGRFTYSPNSVSGTRAMRTLQVDREDPSEGFEFLGAEYFLISGERYRDRAGNPLGDTFGSLR